MATFGCLDGTVHLGQETHIVIQGGSYLVQQGDYTAHDSVKRETNMFKCHFCIIIDALEAVCGRTDSQRKREKPEM